MRKIFFVKDFYTRTLCILNSYNGEYDVTILINFMLGLLIVPKEKYWNIMRDFQLSEETHAIVIRNIRENTYGDEETIKNIVKHLRNAVSHGRMTIFGERPCCGENVEIKSIQFIDENRTNRTKRFVIEFTVDELKNFLIEFATNISGEAQNSAERR